MTYPTQKELEVAGTIVVDAQRVMHELAEERLVGLIRERFPEARAVLLTSEVVDGSTWWTVDKITDTFEAQTNARLFEAVGKTLWERWDDEDLDLDGGNFVDGLDNAAGYLEPSPDAYSMTIKIEKDA